MGVPKKFQFGSHARKRGKERDITHALFIEVVTNHEGRKREYRGTHGGIVYLFQKKFDGNTLHVAAEIYKDECFFVTGYWT